MPSSVCTKVELQFTCPECGQPVFAYGPTFSELICAYCDSMVKIDLKQVWKYYLQSPLEEKLNYLGDSIIFYGGLRRPLCMECKAKLNVKEVSDGTDGVVVCPECGAENTTFPAPEWMKDKQAKINGKQMKPVQIFCAEREKSPAPEPEAVAPVLFACLHCGSSLKILPHTPHILSCEYCGSEQYMPDSLWRRFHAVPKKRPWFIRWT